ncbi:MAG: metallophosphoesterase family protein [Erythrobacter sp.]
MKVAVLADIHANIAALARVLDEVRREGIERLVLLGDYVGYCYEPRAVIEALGEFDCIGVQGNHDRMALAAQTDPEVLESYRARYGSGLDAVVEQFGAAEWEWLAQHPVSREVELGTHRILLAHGSPQDPDAYLYPDAAQARFAEACDEFGGEAIWLGHTHWPLLRPGGVGGGPSILNPGSVGQPRDIGGLASWAVFHVDTGAVAFRRTEFATVTLAEQCLRRDPLLPRLGKALTRNRIGEPA